MNKLSVNVGNELIEIDYGTTLESLSKNYQSLFKYEIIVAKVDGIYKELTETITKSCCSAGFHTGLWDIICVRQVISCGWMVLSGFLLLCWESGN